MPPKWLAAPQGHQEGGRRLTPHVLAPRTPASPYPLGLALASALQPSTLQGLSIIQRAVSQHSLLQVPH